MAAPSETNLAAAPRPFSFTNPSTSFSSSTALAKTSRFVEGSMSSRTSAPLPVSLAPSKARDTKDVVAEAPRPSTATSNTAGGALASFAARPIFSRHSFQSTRPSMQSLRMAAQPVQTSASTVSTTTASTATTTAPSKRPRSFLGPFWDGVTRRLHRRTRSQSEPEKQHLQQPQKPQSQSQPPTTLTDCPTPDEIFANYQQLMEAGFFRRRAIPATRQGLSWESRESQETRDRHRPPPTAAAAATVGGGGTALSPMAEVHSQPNTPRGTKRGHTEEDEDDDDIGKGGDSTTPSQSVPCREQQPRKLRKSTGRATVGSGDDSSNNTRAIAVPVPVDTVPSRPPLSMRPRSLRHRAVAPPQPPRPLVEVHQAEAPRSSQKIAQGMAAAATVAAAEVVDTTSRAPDKAPAPVHVGRRFLLHQAPPVPSKTASGMRTRRAGVGAGSGASAVTVLSQARQPSPQVAAKKTDDDTGASSYRAPTRPAPQPPISFHYPQRVRVRRPRQEVQTVQAVQAVQVEQVSQTGSRDSRRSQRQASQTCQTKQGFRSQLLRRLPSWDNRELMSKPPAMSTEDEENEEPLW